MLLANKHNIQALDITPGKIYNILFAQLHPTLLAAKNKVMDYSLSFTLTNKLDINSIIRVQFPQAFLIVVDSRYQRVWVKSGLEGECKVEVVVTNVNNYLQLSSFVQPSTITAIELEVRMVNPNQKGMTTPLQITSYLSPLLTPIVDQDLYTARTQIYSTPSGNMVGQLHGIQLFTGTAHTSDASTVSFQLQVRPSQIFPASGYIQVTLHSSFQLDINPATFNIQQCKVNIITAGVSTLYPVQSCTYDISKRQIKMQYLIDKTIPVDAQNVFIQFQNVLKKPNRAGTFLFDINLFDTDANKLLESCSDFVTLTPLSFKQSSVSIIGNDCNNRGLLELSLQLQVHSLLSGGNQLSQYSSKGQLVLTFEGQWSQGLGLSKVVGQSIDCRAKQGISPVQGQSLTCTYAQSATLQPQIILSNFQPIDVLTTFVLQIPNILFTTDVTSKILVEAQNITHRQVEVINSVTFQNIECQNSGLTVEQDMIMVSYSSLEVQSNVDIVMELPLKSNINGGHYGIIQLPVYDKGLIVENASVGCQLSVDNGNTFVDLQCVSFAGVDWLLFSLSQWPSLSSGVQVKVSGLQWPNYSASTSSPVSMNIYSVNKHAVLFKQSNGFLATPTPSSFSTAHLHLASSKIDNVNTLYTFTFTSTKYIPPLATLQIDWPTVYSLLNTHPLPTLTSPDLSSPTLTTVINNHQILVNNLPLILKNQVFTIIVKGVRNPQQQTTSYWSASISINSHPIITHPNFQQLQLGNKFTSGKVIFDQIKAFPINAGTKGDYEFVFRLENPLGKGGEIQISFPRGQYRTLPSQPECWLSGALDTFSGCSLSGQTITLTTASDYIGGQIHLGINNVINPDKGVTNPFTISTYYDSQLLDSSTNGPTSNVNTLTTENKPNSLQVNQLTFDPRNEGEPAEYLFSFVPSADILQEQTVFLRFPVEYDPTLGPQVQCKVVSGLVATASLNCQINNRKVLISGFNNYQTSTLNPIIIKIINVVNPNSVGNGQLTGYFQIGVLLKNKIQMSSLNSQAGQVEVLSAPYCLDLQSIRASHYDCRLLAHYYLQFQLNMKMAKTSSGGKLLVKLPSLSFQLPDNNRQPCDTPNGSKFSSVVFCSSSLNTVSIEGHTNDYSGQVSVNIRDVLNPIGVGLVDPIIVRSYDLLNHLILEKSYYNLSPVDLSYSLPGPVISINNDQPLTLEVGRQSQYIQVKVGEPCKLNLTLQPILTGHIHIVPSSIDIGIGESSKQFRVTVPLTTPPGTYRIGWSTLGDMQPVYYTPVQHTVINVIVSNRQSLNIMSIPPVPLGGSSLAVAVVASHPPDIGLTLLLNLQQAYQGVNVFPKILYLSPLSTTCNFTIYSTGGFQGTGVLNVQLTGVDAPYFQLQSDSLPFTIVPADHHPPSLLSSSLHSIHQTQATFTFTPSEPCLVYIQLSLEHSPIIPLVSLQKYFSKWTGESPLPPSIPPDLLPITTQTQVFQLMSTTTHSIVLPHLTAQQPYSLHFHLFDKGYNTYTPPSIQFNTLPRAPPVALQLQLHQLPPSTLQQQYLLMYIQHALSLPTTSSQVSVQCLLPAVPSQPLSSLVLLDIASQPASPYQPTPSTLSSLLSHPRFAQLLTSSLPSFQTSLSTSIYPSTVPTYLSPPQFKTKHLSSLMFSVSLSSVGVIYALAIESSVDKGAQIQPRVLPTGFQIANGLDYSNNRTPFLFSNST